MLYSSCHHVGSKFIALDGGDVKPPPRVTHTPLASNNPQEETNKLGLLES